MDYSIREMENLLEDALIPVEPSILFMKDLKSQLLDREIDTASQSLWGKIQNKLLLVGGVVGSIVVLVGGIKALINVLQLVAEGIRGLSKLRSKPKAATSA
jgi:hypothetical protein